jgi:hypothetical protein
MNKVGAALASLGLFDVGADRGGCAKVLLSQNPARAIFPVLQILIELNGAQGVSERPGKNLAGMFPSRGLLLRNALISRIHNSPFTIYNL